MARRSAVDRFVAAAVVRGVTVDVHRHPDGTRTAEDAARAIGCDLAQIVKSLVFATDDGYVLALTSGANRVDTEALGRLVGRPVRRADADGVRAATGYAIGGTPPFGHDTSLDTVIDPDLLAFEVVWAACGTPDSVFPIAPDELVRASGATVGAFTMVAGP